MNFQFYGNNKYNSSDKHDGMNASDILAFVFICECECDLFLYVKWCKYVSISIVCK